MNSIGLQHIVDFWFSCAKIIQEFMKDADQNKDGLIDFEEVFVNFVAGDLLVRH